MPVSKSKRFGRPGNLLQVLARNQDIDVSGQPSRIWRGFLNIEICRQSANYPVLQSRGGKDLFDCLDQPDQLFQAHLEESINDQRLRCLQTPFSLTR